MFESCSEICVVFVHCCLFVWGASLFFAKGNNINKFWSFSITTNTISTLNPGACKHTRSSLWIRVTTTAPPPRELFPRWVLCKYWQAWMPAADPQRRSCQLLCFISFDICWWLTRQCCKRWEVLQMILACVEVYSFLLKNKQLLFFTLKCSLKLIDCSSPQPEVTYGDRWAWRCCCRSSKTEKCAAHLLLKDSSYCWCHEAGVYIWEEPHWLWTHQTQWLFIISHTHCPRYLFMFIHMQQSQELFFFLSLTVRHLDYVF